MRSRRSSRCPPDADCPTRRNVRPRSPVGTGGQVPARRLRPRRPRRARGPQPTLELVQKSVGPVELQSGDSGNQAEVRFSAGDRGGGGDEPGLATHELHQADAVQNRLRFDVGPVDRLFGLGHGGGETERAPAEVDVVVDRLGDADDRYRQAATGNLARNRMGSSLRAVAADAEQDVDLQTNQLVNRHVHLLATTRRPQHRPTRMVNRRHRLGRQIERRIARRGQSTKAVANAQHALHPVVVHQLEDQRTNHVVQAGTQPAARHHRRRHLGRVEEQLTHRAPGVQEPGPSAAPPPGSGDRTIPRCIVADVARAGTCGPNPSASGEGYLHGPSEETFNSSRPSWAIHSSFIAIPHADTRRPWRQIALPAEPPVQSPIDDESCHRWRPTPRPTPREPCRD